MKTNKWENRDKKRNKRINGMRVSGKSVFLLQEIVTNKAKEVKKEKEREGAQN